MARSKNEREGKVMEKGRDLQVLTRLLNRVLTQKRKMQTLSRCHLQGDGIRQSLKKLLHFGDLWHWRKGVKGAKRG